MPILPMKDLSLISASLYMWAAIAFPNDRKQQDAYVRGITGGMTSGLVEMDFAKPSSKNYVEYTKLVKEGAEFPHMLERLVEKPDFERMLARDFLLTMMSLHRYDKPNARSKKAFDLIQARNIEQGRTISDSKSPVWEAWRKYKCISHFLAAHKLHERSFSKLIRKLGYSDRTSFKALLSVDTDLNVDEDDFETRLDNNVEFVFLVLEIMGTAKQIGKDASKAFSHGQEALKNPLLKPQDIWRFPGKLWLPKIEVSYPPLSSEDKRRLSGR